MTTGATRFTYVQVAESLKADIGSEALKPGERLPSIREIAARFDVSPGTASNALAHLRSLGLIRSNSTRGYFVEGDASTGATTQRQGQSLVDQLDALRDEMRRLAARVDHLEGVIRDGAAPGPSTER